MRQRLRVVVIASCAGLSGPGAAAFAEPTPFYAANDDLFAPETANNPASNKSSDTANAPDATKTVEKIEPVKAPDDPAPKIAPPEQKPAPKKGVTVVDIQTNKSVQEQSYKDGDITTDVRLTNLNPSVNAWVLMEVKTSPEKTWRSYHLENALPNSQMIMLSADYEAGVVLQRKNESIRCELWKGGADSLLNKIKRTKPYTEICDGRLFIRNKVDGYRTTKEWVVEFLRDNVWGGEQITSFIKNTVYKDAFLIEGSESKKVPGPISDADSKMIRGARLEPENAGVLLEPKGIGLKIQKPADESGKMLAGKWYELNGQDGVYLSTIQASLIEKSILGSYTDIVKDLDGVEKNAQAFLVGFDLQKFEVGFALGTEHPRMGWSERVRDADRIKGAPGPDGFEGPEPLVPTGLLNPIDAKRIVATFTGGFKRSHGAFKWGDLGKKNNGSHYGFIEQGVVFSRLNPDLATFLVDKNGLVHMKTWTEADQVGVSDIRFARQNGVPIIDFDPITQTSRPGKLVSNWMQGNWSGSEDMKFRTLRAGLCLQVVKDRRYLVYGYFSSVTPSAMARIFQAYDCRYAFHLDMNALEHTYLATYIMRDDKNYYPQHLMSEMEVLDQRFKGNVPRFIGYPDNRDFFYVVRRFKEELLK